MEPTWLGYGIGSAIEEELQSDVGVDEVEGRNERTRFLYGNSCKIVTIRTQTRNCTRVCFPANLRDDSTSECRIQTEHNM